MQHLLEFVSWGNDLQSLYSYLKGFKNGDPKVLESIIKESTDDVFMIELYRNFCKTNSLPRTAIKHDIMGNLFGNRKNDRYIDFEKLKSQIYYNNFLQYLAEDDLIRLYYNRYPEIDFSPCWFYFHNPEIINKQTEVIHYSMGDVKFKGVKDYSKLGGTTRFDSLKDEDGFMFGFLPSDLENKKVFYGKKENILLVSKCIRFYHIADKEYQCIFSIKDIINK